MTTIQALTCSWRPPIIPIIEDLGCTFRNAHMSQIAHIVQSCHSHTFTHFHKCHTNVTHFHTLLHIVSCHTHVTHNVTHNVTHDVTHNVTHCAGKEAQFLAWSWIHWTCWWQVNEDDLSNIFKMSHRSENVKHATFNFKH